MAQQLQKKESQLKALGAFYKEQLAQLEQKNLERFKESKDQFHQAATVTEASVRNENKVCNLPCLECQNSVERNVTKHSSLYLL
ncbi:MICOS complex subunit mic25a [Ameca splendens]|uniref:MICOS complex subunit mic25a n=1 Tax=Ameca splendens TaxID=208324 RepID=A0ABV1A7Y0_9TELE